jgi:hypothetical protein
VLSSILATTTVSTTATYASPNAITLDAAATTAVSNGTASIGTNDTAAIASAVAATSTWHTSLFFPDGTYFTDTITGINNVGITISGAGSQSSVLKSAFGKTVVEITGASIHDLTISKIGIDGNAGNSNHGIYFHNNKFVFSSVLNEINVWDVGGNGFRIYEMFSSQLSNIQASSNGADALWLSTGPAMTIVNAYMHHSGVGYAGYRLASGVFNCIGCNGIDNGSNISTDWGVLSSTIAEDGFLGYTSLNLTGSNVEGFSRYGIRLKGGMVTMTNSHILANQPASTPQAIRTDLPSGEPMVLTNVPITTDKGAVWADGYAIHGTTACPYIMWHLMINQALLPCYSEGGRRAISPTSVSGVGAAYGVSVLEWNQIASLDAYFGHLTGIGPTPTISSGFGTAPTISGNDSNGHVVIGTGGTAKTGQIRWGTAYSRTYVNCYVRDITTQSLNAGLTWAATTTGLTITSSSAFTAGDIVSWQCMGH